MNSITRRTALCALILSMVSQVLAAESATTTVITVGEMCGGCVRKITERLQKMPGVASIQCDMKTKSVTVTHASGKSLSARTLWVAMEEIGKAPKKLAGPEGTFTSKPRG